MTKPLFLPRYDTEAAEVEEMAGFLEKAVEIHRRHEIPATFFCTGRALEARRDQFREFRAEVRNDPLFDLQDHSYSHIGIGYESNPPLDTTKADYERSFDVHESVFGKRPVAVSLCGTGGRDGKRLAGFDASDKAKREFEMLAGLGVKAVNCFLTGVKKDREFCSFARLGHPDIMGFPSALCDTNWMVWKDPADWQWKCREPFEPVADGIVEQIRERGRAGIHTPLLMHDWAAWKMAPGRNLDHVVTFAAAAVEAGFELVTHMQCYERPHLWAGEPR